MDGLGADLDPPKEPARLDAGAERKLIAAFVIVVFGIPPCIARGGFLLGLPTSLLGVAIAAGVAARDGRRLGFLARLTLGLASGYALRGARPEDAGLAAFTRTGRRRTSRTLVEAATGAPLARIARGASLWPLARLAAAALIVVMGLALGGVGAALAVGLVKVADGRIPRGPSSRTPIAEWRGQPPKRRPEVGFHVSPSRALSRSGVPFVTTRDPSLPTSRRAASAGRSVS